MNTTGSPHKRFTILFTCIGRRVALERSFREAAQTLGFEPIIIGTDTTNLSSALQLCDKKFIVCSVKDTDYINQILKIVEENHVDILIPTVDLDLGLLAENEHRFAQIGCKVLISRPEVIAICQNKMKTFEFLSANGFSTPRTYTPASALENKDISFPCFLKPWDGYASRGTAVANDFEELVFYSKRIPNCIVQEYIKGEEFTCDVYVTAKGQALCIVPRKRIEVRSGEVSKSKVVMDQSIIDQTRDLVETLGAGPGVITVQMIRDASGKIYFIEINPRFGGGAPLSIRAGANFPLWIVNYYSGIKKDLGIANVTIQDGLTMLRYDAEVWI